MSYIFVSLKIQMLEKRRWRCSHNPVLQHEPQLIAMWFFFQIFYFTEFTKHFHILHLIETSQQQYSIINVRLGKLFSSEL